MSKWGGKRDRDWYRRNAWRNKKAPTTKSVPGSSEIKEDPPPANNGPKITLQLKDNLTFCSTSPPTEELIKFYRSIRGFKLENKGKLWCFPMDQYEFVLNTLKKKKVNLSPIPPTLLDMLKSKLFNDNSFDFSGMPVELTQHLLNFQWKGVKFALARGGKCLIADDMGLGKTIQAIAIATCYISEWPLLVIVPSALRQQWKEEFSRWIPRMTCEVNVISDGKGNFDSLINIVSYRLAATMEQEIKKKNFSVIICDECHQLKSESAQRTKAIIPVVRAARRRILLSGTPEISRPGELYSQLEALDAQIFPTFHDFALRYCAAYQDFRGWNYTGSSNLDELNYFLKNTVMIRRLKTDVLDELPPKVRHVVDIELEEDSRGELEKIKGKIEKKADLLAGAGSDKFLSLMDSQKKTAIMAYFGETGRAKANPAASFVIEKVKKEAENKVLVFAHHLEVLDVLGSCFEDSSISYLRIDGSTPEKSRHNRINAFQNNKHIKIMILSINCAGVGLNLTAASTVVFAELFWTPGSLLQAEDRSHRIGQKRDVHIYYLLAKNTVDDLIWPLIGKKLAVVGRSINGSVQHMVPPSNASKFQPLITQFVPLVEKSAPTEKVESPKQPSVESPKQPSVKAPSQSVFELDPLLSSPEGQDNEAQKKEEELSEEDLVEKMMESFALESEMTEQPPKQIKRSQSDDDIQFRAKQQRLSVPEKEMPSTKKPTFESNQLKSLGVGGGKKSTKNEGTKWNWGSDESVDSDEWNDTADKEFFPTRAGRSSLCPPAATLQLEARTKEPTREKARNTKNNIPKKPPKKQSEMLRTSSSGDIRKFFGKAATGLGSEGRSRMTPLQFESVPEPKGMQKMSKRKDSCGDFESFGALPNCFKASKGKLMLKEVEKKEVRRSLIEEEIVIEMSSRESEEEREEAMELLGRIGMKEEEEKKEEKEIRVKEKKVSESRSESKEMVIEIESDSDSTLSVPREVKKSKKGKKEKKRKREESEEDTERDRKRSKKEKDCDKGAKRGKGKEKNGKEKEKTKKKEKKEDIYKKKGEATKKKEKKDIHLKEIKKKEKEVTKKEKEDIHLKHNIKKKEKEAPKKKEEKEVPKKKEKEGEAKKKEHEKDIKKGSREDTKGTHYTKKENGNSKQKEETSAQKDKKQKQPTAYSSSETTDEYFSDTAPAPRAPPAPEGGRGGAPGGMGERPEGGGAPGGTGDRPAESDGDSNVENDVHEENFLQQRKTTSLMDLGKVLSAKKHNYPQQAHPAFSKVSSSLCPSSQIPQKFILTTKKL